MSDFTIIGDISKTLQKLLEDDPWTDIEISSKPEIIFKSPKEIQDDQGGINKISLFLYQILENPYLKNHEPLRDDDSYFQMPPFIFDLLYLITAYGQDEVQEKYIMGKVMQIFHDHTILSGTVLQGTLSETDEKIRLVFNPISLDDLTKIWNTFHDVGYRPSLSYLVTPIQIDSVRKASVNRVISKEIVSLNIKN